MSKLYRFFIEYETGLKKRKEQIIIATNSLEAISAIINSEKQHHLKKWSKYPLGMISIRARLPTE